MKKVVLCIGLLFVSTLVFAQEGLEDVKYDEEGSFAVQVEAWRSEVKAEQRVAFWKDQGFEYASYAADGDDLTGDLWFRVFLGRFANIENAQQFQDIFAGMFNSDTWITTTNGDSKPMTKL